MKKVIGFLLVVFVISACGPTLLQSITADVKLKNHSYPIYVKTLARPTDCDIFLYVNDQEIAKGTVSSIRPTTAFSGTYEGVKIDAECGGGKTRDLFTIDRCIIYVKDQKVVELSY
jgi:hypothetical protein